MVKQQSKQFKQCNMETQGLDIKCCGDLTPTRVGGVLRGGYMYCGGVGRSGNRSHIPIHSVGHHIVT